MYNNIEPRLEISNNVVCVTSKGSGQNATYICSWKSHVAAHIFLQKDEGLLWDITSVHVCQLPLLTIYLYYLRNQ